MLTIKLPRVIANDVVFEEPQGFRIVRVISRDNDTVIELDGKVVDFRANDIERTLAEAGKRIHAIKAYRERTGVELKDAKDAIDLAVPVPQQRDW